MADARLSLSPSWHAPLFIDRRSLTERQRKYLELFAADIEGRPTAEGTNEAASSNPSESQPPPPEAESEEKPLGG